MVVKSDIHKMTGNIGELFGEISLSSSCPIKVEKNVNKRRNAYKSPELVKDLVHTLLSLCGLEK